MVRCIDLNGDSARMSSGTRGVIGGQWGAGKSYVSHGRGGFADIRGVAGGIQNILTFLMSASGKSSCCYQVQYQERSSSRSELSKAWMLVWSIRWH